MKKGTKLILSLLLFHSPLLLSGCRLAQDDDAKGIPMKSPLIVTDPSQHGGERIGLYGSLSQEPHQHLVHAEAGRSHAIRYLKVDDGSQVVVYTPKSFSGCPGPLRIEGEVLEVRPQPSTPGEPQKRDQDPGLVEYQLLGESWRCIDGEGPESWLRELGLAATSPERRSELSEQLLLQGKPVVPLLLLHLKDQRLSGTRLHVPGAAINAPPNTPVPQPIIIPVTVAERVDELLYTLITPAYASPYAGNFKPFTEVMFRVSDWRAFWLAREGQSLDEIRKSLEPAVDAFWKNHGTVQVLN